ncbi:hypothetical protein CsSME_00047342 [Camellia sinensis var. sinensis]
MRHFYVASNYLLVVVTLYAFLMFVKVELAHGGRGNSASIDRYSSYSSGRGPRGGVSRRSEYRVLVSGLPSSASWQDLKDHMRRAGDVCFSQVFRDGSGMMTNKLNCRIPCL